MLIHTLRIQNFRSVEALDLELGTTTVFIGANNAGKSAILEALRIALTRRWGQRGTGFTEHDVFASGPDIDPRTLPPVTIQIELEDSPDAPWPEEQLQELADVLTTHPDGRNAINLRITCGWNSETESFEPAWSFLNWQREMLGNRSQRSINFSLFFAYLPLFWLHAIRDAGDAFAPRSQLWGQLVKSIRIPSDTEGEVQAALDALDAKILKADPKLDTIAETIGQATTIAIGEGPGGARLRMLPLNVPDLLLRAGIVMRHEDQRPWLPLDHHGQGLQSLAVMFLFQAAVSEQLRSANLVGAEPVFAIEEPEAHLHPQAARTVWERISALPGQKVVTTHSPYFVQHVPLRDLRVVRLVKGRTTVAQMPRRIRSILPWNEKLAKLADHSGGRLIYDRPTGCAATTAWLPPALAASLVNCWKEDPRHEQFEAEITRLRLASRVMVTPGEEQELGFFGRRIRGEIFFARRWALVEGVSEYLLLHAIGRALGTPLDAHGIAVIDFQNNGNASIYPSLAAAFDIPWRMVTDGDAESVKFRKQMLDRGFSEMELNVRLSTLDVGNDLEDQLLADGHEMLLREILTEQGNTRARTMPQEELLRRLKNEKTEYTHGLAQRVVVDPDLAGRMPAAFLTLMRWLQSNLP